MKYTQVNPDAFKQIQLNAGVLTETFDPDTGEVPRSDILTATSGGVTFTAVPTFTDFAEDIDNVPKNTMEFMKIDDVEVKLTASSVTMTPRLAKIVAAAADIDGMKVVPRKDLLAEDFGEVWWVGDYSDVNTGDYAGFIAIHMLNTLSTGGFKLTSEDKGKGKFDIELTGHYSMEDTDQVPYEVYIKDGGEPAPGPKPEPGNGGKDTGA